MKDLQLTDNRIFQEIKSENDRQITKWGPQDRNPWEWLAYLTEEVGELSEAIQQHEYRAGLISHIVNEAIQVATLASKIAEMYLNQTPE